MMIALTVTMGTLMCSHAMTMGMAEVIEEVANDASACGGFGSSCGGASGLLFCKDSCILRYHCSTCNIQIII